MKRFKFQLQAVLEQRERREKQAIQTLAEAIVAQADAEMTLDDLLELKQHLFDSLTAVRLSGNIDPQEQVAYQDYIQQVCGDITVQETVIADLTAITEEFRRSMVEATQEKRIVDDLRDRSKSAHYQDQLRAEQTESDEMASLRHQYNKMIDRAA